MEQLPYYISLTFIITTVFVIYLFYIAAGKNKKILGYLFIWSALVAAITAIDFFEVYDTIPPRLIWIVLPPLLLVISIFSTSRGKKFIDSLDLKTLTILQVVRVPVEIVLFWLYLHKAVPELMTFEGKNFDIFSGLSAPVIYYFVFIKKSAGKFLLLAWNITCLGLVAFIVFNAVLSAPTLFQQFAFDQPNIAVSYFPFVWLPAVVVPLCYFSHLVSIKRILKEVKYKSLKAFSNQ